MSRPQSLLTRAFLPVALTASLGTPSSAQPARTDTSRGLSIQYVDGRTTTLPLKPKGGMWTPNFPRIPGSDTTRDGIRLSTIDVKFVVDGADVDVTVSLVYGAPDKDAVKVASVRLSPGTSIRVAELRAYGVEPITLSLVAIPAVDVFPPEAVSVSAQIDLRVDPAGPNSAAYRVTLTNRSNYALMWMRFRGFRGGKALSARPRGKRNLPLVPANGEHTFEMAIAGSQVAPGDRLEAWRPFERFEITSLMWEDGIVEGDREAAKQQARFDASRAEHLREFVAVLRGARPESIPALRARLAQTMDADPETREARDAVLADLESLESTGRSRDGLAFEAWLKRTIDEHQQWLSRIVLPKL
jgi:hypothetical protein